MNFDWLGLFVTAALPFVLLAVMCIWVIVDYFKVAVFAVEGSYRQKLGWDAAWETLGAAVYKSAIIVALFLLNQQITNLIRQFFDQGLVYVIVFVILGALLAFAVIFILILLLGMVKFVHYVLGLKNA